MHAFTPVHYAPGTCPASVYVTIHDSGGTPPSYPPAGHMAKSTKSTANQPPSIAELMSCSTSCHYVHWAGGRKRKDLGFKVERHDHLLVPMSCELPQMKGRNWKSSRPHTPWLPAGSILYVFCNFRITSRYLCRGEGEQGEKRDR